MQLKRKKKRVKLLKKKKKRSKLSKKRRKRVMKLKKKRKKAKRIILLFSSQKKGNMFYKDLKTK